MPHSRYANCCYCKFSNNTKPKCASPACVAMQFANEIVFMALILAVTCAKQKQEVKPKNVAIITITFSLLSPCKQQHMFICMCVCVCISFVCHTHF